MHPESELPGISPDRENMAPLASLSPIVTVPAAKVLFGLAVVAVKADQVPAPTIRPTSPSTTIDPSTLRRTLLARPSEGAAIVPFMLLSPIHVSRRFVVPYRPAHAPSKGL